MRAAEAVAREGLAARRAPDARARRPRRRLVLARNRPPRLDARAPDRAVQAPDDVRDPLAALRHLQRLSLGFYERNRAGVIISRLTNDVEALDQLVTDGVTSLVQNTLTLLGSAIVLFLLSWKLALATLTVVPFLIVGTAMFRKRSARSYRGVREKLAVVTATLAEDIAGMRVLQA